MFVDQLHMHKRTQTYQHAMSRPPGRPRFVCKKSHTSRTLYIGPLRHTK